MTSPYEGLPARAFWRSGAVERPRLEFAEFYQPKFRIHRQMKIATAGSCFAQHVGRALREAQYYVIDTEPAPQTIPDAVAHKFGFRLYSARYGNIYTARQLLQLWREVRGGFKPAMPIWERDGRFYDALRPAIEPGGFATPEDVLRHRAPHLKAVRRAFLAADVIVFTFGLTEAWLHSESGTVYPTAPGTLAGQFDPALFNFHNFEFPEVLAQFSRFRDLIMERNPTVKFLVTVSPVPLTATASGGHVEVATAYSKSVLRAVCGSLVAQFDNVDYFPSFEIITSQRNAAAFYASNLREVTEAGVAAAMGTFLAAHLDPEDAIPAPERSDSEEQLTAEQAADGDLVCEEALLDAFRT